MATKSTAGIFCFDPVSGRHTTTVTGTGPWMTPNVRGLAYDAAKGTKIWLKRYNPGDGGGVHFATALGVTPDGTRFTQAAAL